MPHYKLQPVSWPQVKTELKIAYVTDFMAFLVKAMFRWNESSKNAEISILSNFLEIFVGFFSISRNFTRYFLHAKLQINRIIQTETTEGEILPPPPPPPPAIPICKKVN